MQNVPRETHVYRWRVVESFLYAGIACSKIEMLRPLLEREGHTLTSRSHLESLYIPQIEAREVKRLTAEMKDKHFTLVFDGTTRLGEAIALVTRCITNDFNIQMRLIAFKTTKVHLNGDALFRLIVTTLQRDLGLDLDLCIGFARDSCPTNHDALQRCAPLAPNAVAMLCFVLLSRTLHNLGKHLGFSVLDEFMTSCLQLVPRPGAAKLRWETILGKGCSRSVRCDGGVGGRQCKSLP